MILTSRDFFFGFCPSRSLRGHSSCVNALAFSNGDGRFLASGGDGTQLPQTAQRSPELKHISRLIDLQIQLFDFQQEDLACPSWAFVGPTVCFSCMFQCLGSADGAVRDKDQRVFTGIFCG